MNLTRTVSWSTLVASGVNMDGVFRFGRAGSEIDLTENEVRVLRLALVAYQYLGLGAFRTAFNDVRIARRLQASLEGDKAVFSLYRRDGTVDRT